MTPADPLAAAPGRGRWWTPSQAGEYRFTYLLVVLVFLMFVAAPLAEMGVLPQIAVDASFILLLVAGAASVFGRRPMALILVAVGVPALIARTIHVGQPTWPLAVLSNVLTLVLFALLTAAVLGPVLGPGHITLRRVEGAVVVYLLLAILWGMAYLLLVDFVPDAFSVSRPEPYALMYFSLVTLSTAGYGDIVPVHPLARSLAAAEALAGPLYLAILVARLVSQALAARSAE